MRQVHRAGEKLFIDERIVPQLGLDQRSGTAAPPRTRSSGYDAPVPLGTKRSCNCASHDTTLAMVFKLLQSAQKHRKGIKGFRKLELVVNKVQFRDGVHVNDQSNRLAA